MPAKKGKYMNDDKTLINKLWWLNKFLNTQFGDKEFAQIVNEKLDVDTCRELDDIVLHIKENY